MTPIGKRIRELRTKRGLSQGDIERSTGMLRAYISRVERGHTVPSVTSIERFATALGTPIHELFLEARPERDSVGRSSKKEDSFLFLISGYIRRMDSARRRFLMQLAEQLAQKDQK